MRSTINVEFTGEELRGHVEELGRRWIAFLLGRVWNFFDSMDPQTYFVMQQAMQNMIAQGVQLGQQHHRRQRGPVPHAHPHAPPWPFAGMGPPPPTAQTGPVPAGYGPHPGYGPATPGGYGGAPYPGGAPAPDNVQPIRSTAELTHCFAIEATRNTEAGWGCHCCATFNGVTRAACRHCGHPRCDVIVPPPRSQEPPRVPPQPEPVS